MILNIRPPHELLSIRPNIVCKDYLPLIQNAPHIIYSQGGVGKSYISIRVAIHFLLENKKSKAFLWLTEDDEGETRYRFYEILKDMEVDYEAVKGRISFSDQSPVKFNRLKDGNADVSAEFFEIRKELIDYDFIVIDPLLQFQGGEENSNTHAGVFMALLKAWCKEDGKTIVILHHMTMTSYGVKARGAGDWVNGTRGAYYISTLKAKNSEGELDEDMTKSHQRQIQLTKDNGLSRYVIEKYESKSFILDVFPNKNKTPQITHYKKDYHVEVASYVMPVEDTYSMPVTLNEPEPIETVTISVANHNNEKEATGFIKKVVRWDELFDVITMGKAYAPAGFIDGHRKNENYLGDTNVVFLDIDSGMTLNEAHTLFSPLKCFIVTTRSHQKDKKGVVCDRFRVVIKLDSPIDLKADEYSIAMQSVFNSFGSVDRSTKDPARFYFASPSDCEVWFSDGTQELDWKELYAKEKKLRAIDLLARQSYVSPIDATTEDITKALSRINPDCGYDDWFRIGMALKAELGDAGFDIWDSWSARGNSYKQSVMESKWKSFTGGSTTIGTLFYLSKGL